MAFANAGLDVTLCERDRAALDRGMALIRKNYDITAAKGKLDAAGVQARMARISPSLDLADLAQADLVIEAVFGGHGRQAGRSVSWIAISQARAILATYTSRLNIDEIAACSARPEAVIGLHFFSPANVMKLLKRKRGARTGSRRDRHLHGRGAENRQDPVLVGVCEGFAGNRMLTGHWREAGFPLEEGASRGRSTARSRASAWPWGPWPWPTWRAWTSTGPRASAWLPRGPRTCAIPRSPTASANWADRPEDGRAITATSRSREPLPIRWSTASSKRARARRASSAARCPTRKSSSAACWRWSTKARASSKKASRSALPT